MDIINGYDSDEEFQFSPTSEDWSSSEPLLANTKQLRSEYSLLGCIGKGSYSSVYKVKNLTTGELLCAKNYYPQRKSMDRNDSDYYDISSHGKTELSILQTLHHPSILPVRGVFRGRRRGSVYMVTDLYDTTLDTLLINHAPLSLSEKKCILREILSVLSYLQSHHLLHSDLKPGNLLYRRGGVALCDWGSAAAEGHRGLLPTLGYRPPELLLWDRNGSTARWSCACDVWSWAVVATELVGGKYLWNSDSELLVTNSAVKLAGTEQLTEEQRRRFDAWSSAVHLKFPAIPSTFDQVIGERFPESARFLAMLRRCFQLLPEQRPDAESLLDDPWWSETPVACSPDLLPDVKEWLRELRERKQREIMDLFSQLQSCLDERENAV